MLRDRKTRSLDFSNSAKKRRIKSWAIAALLIILMVFPAGLVISGSRAPLNVTIVLSSAPERSPEPAIFMQYNSTNATYSYVTQECYRAEVLFKNIGSSAVVPGPYRGPMSVEILEEDSTNWMTENQFRFGLEPIVSPGQSLAFALRIPISAKKWRVNCSYQRWFPPHRYLNYILRDWMKLDVQVGDQTIYEVTSDTWSVPHAIIPGGNSRPP